MPRSIRLNRTKSLLPQGQGISLPGVFAFLACIGLLYVSTLSVGSMAANKKPGGKNTDMPTLSKTYLEKIQKLETVAMPREWDWDETIRGLGLPERWEAVMKAIQERKEETDKAKDLKQISALKNRKKPFAYLIYFNHPMHCTLCAGKARKTSGDFIEEIISPASNQILDLGAETLHGVQEHGGQFSAAQLDQLARIFK
jgi:hypothetical protein